MNPSPSRAQYCSSKKIGKLLIINENKTAMFAFLSISIATMSTDKQVTCAIDSGEMFRQPCVREGLAPCSHEAAYSGMMVHIADAASKYKF